MGFIDHLLRKNRLHNVCYALEIVTIPTHSHALEHHHSHEARALSAFAKSVAVFAHLETMNTDTKCAFNCSHAKKIDRKMRISTNVNMSTHGTTNIAYAHELFFLLAHGSAYDRMLLFFRFIL